MTETSTPLVTVVTPTYNHEQYIGPCIESVLSQSYPHWEQVIVDDGSQDRTPDIVHSYKEPRIRYLRQENLGILRLAETYNRALGAARGQLVAILEGDDFWPSDKLETLVPAFVDPQVILAYGLTCFTTPSGRPMKWTTPPYWFREPYTRSGLFNDPVGSATRLMARADAITFTFPCSVLIRSSVLKGIGGFQSSPRLPFVDYPTFLNLSLRGRFFFIPKVMGYWRQRLQSATWTRDAEATDRELFRYVCEFLDRHGNELRLTESEKLTIEKTWDDTRPMRCFYRGRQLLLLERWPEARQQFTEALAARTFRERLKARLGCWAGWLHQDLEGLVRVVKGREYDFRERFGLRRG